MKTCSRCKVEKASTDFHKNSNRSDGLQRYCKQCKRQEYLDNKPAIVKRQRGYSTKYRYGITEQEYDSRHDQQGGQCSICGAKGKLHLDHNHSTGELREFLCSNCNLALGLLNEDPERMERMIAYVRKHEREVV